jgi:hypothetical protein
VPYPSPTTYPSNFLYPGTSRSHKLGDPVALGDIVLNAVDDFGVHWILESFDGWDSPGSTVSLTQRARGHGATASEPFFTPRVMTLSGYIAAPDVASGLAARDRLAAAVSLDPFEVLVAEGDSVRNVTAMRQDAVIWKRNGEAEASFSVQIVAPDPLKYGDLVSQSTLLPSSSGGLTYPVTYPITYTGVSTSGVLRVVNEGNTQAPVWLRVDGPIPAGGWTVTHVGKRQTLSFATSLALAAGEFVTVDMQRREVLAQGQSARAGYVTSRGWFTLDPGDNDIAFSAQNYSATAQLTITTKPAWS